MKNIETKISAIVLVGGDVDKSLLDTCLKSVSWCNEILKVETKGVRGSFSEWRNFGAKKAKNNWILYVDADEEITTLLKDEISSEIELAEFSGYAIPRRNFIWGQEMKHCGLYPDYVVRFIKKNKFPRGDLFVMRNNFCRSDMRPFFNMIQFISGNVFTSTGIITKNNKPRKSPNNA